MTLSETFELANGQRIPAIGLGTWRSEPKEINAAVTTALKVGYKHLDCAWIYKNESDIGDVLRELAKDYPRDSIFITSKLWNTYHEPAQVAQGIKETLTNLKTDYLDLYLMHWPVAHLNAGNGDFALDSNGKLQVNKNVTIEQTWAEMEKLVDQGLVRSIGVSNFTVEQIKRILKVARIRPVVNQVELHPYLPQNELLEYCKSESILLEAYSPLGSAPGEGKILSDPTVADIAKKHNVSPAQVLISWAIQRGTVVLPKSTNAGRIEQNLKAVSLSSDDMKKLNDLHKTVKTVRYIDPSEWFVTDNLFKD